MTTKTNTLLASLNNRQRIWRVAHRGGKPENKLVGFRTAIDEGCDMIECDLRLSADNVPVVIHDRTINRTTNGFGLVSKLKMRELQYYGVPSLEDLLILLNQKQTFAAFEIKDIGVKTTLLLKNTLSLLQEHGLVDRSIIISFNRNIIMTCKQVCSQIATGIIIDNAYLSNPYITAAKLQADTLWIHYSLLSKVVNYNTINIPVFMWTINHKKHIVGIDKNIAGIVSDNLSMLYIKQKI